MSDEQSCGGQIDFFCNLDSRANPFQIKVSKKDRKYLDKVDQLHRGMLEAGSNIVYCKKKCRFSELIFLFFHWYRSWAYTSLTVLYFSFLLISQVVYWKTVYNLATQLYAYSDHFGYALGRLFGSERSNGWKSPSTCIYTGQRVCLHGLLTVLYRSDGMSSAIKLLVRTNTGMNQFMYYVWNVKVRRFWLKALVFVRLLFVFSVLKCIFNLCYCLDCISTTAK